LCATLALLPACKKSGAVDAGVQPAKVESIAVQPRPRFAPFPSARVETTAIAKTPTIAADLSNVQITMLLSPEQKARIAKNGFAVTPGTIKEFYELYERARYDYVPIFVTTDSILHAYHLLFDKILRVIEAKTLRPALEKLDRQMLERSLAQLGELRGKPAEQAALRNAAYFAVAVKLLDPSFALPEPLRPLAEPDLKRILDHQVAAPSSIFPAYPFGEDWSQYVPRGHYTKSDALKSYFLAMMWHGRMTMRASDPIELVQSMLLVRALDLKAWNDVYAPTAFVAGESDDLTPLEYQGALSRVGASAVDDATIERFRDEVKALRSPQVLSMAIAENQEIDPSTKGLRFFGQRLVPDAAVFRALIERNVPERFLPRALDLFAALGSERALGHLPESKQPAYQKQMQALRTSLAAIGEDRFTETLYGAWLHTLRPLAQPVPSGFPRFMASAAWQDKSLTTALASWTELKHDTILYSKAVYAEMGAGGMPPPSPIPPKGYVEPEVAVYARLASLSSMTGKGLSERALLTDAMRQEVEKLSTVAGRLQKIAEMELAGRALSEDDYSFIRYYGGELEGMTFDAAEDDDQVGGSPEGGDAVQAAVVADVANDPRHERVLEEGVGRIFEIHVAAPVEGRLVIAKGGAFSHYEFEQPMSARLTDEAWRKQLDEGKEPQLAPWTSSYLVRESVNQGPAEAVRAFTARMVDALWYTSSDRSTDEGIFTMAKTIQAPGEGAAKLLVDPARKELESQIAELKKEGHLIGMERQSLELLSFDFQDEGHCTVSARERWKDELDTGNPDTDEELKKLAERGPYEQVATYTMAKSNGAWIISHIVRRPEAPAWRPVR
jgi:hypothetical protein